MLRLLADEHIDPKLLRGLRARQPELDIVRVHDVGLLGATDQDILIWAAGIPPLAIPNAAPPEVRVLITHDRNTVPGIAHERVRNHQAMTGVLVVEAWLSMGRMIDELLFVAVCSDESELHDQVIYVPL